jgi:hypothetical protein
MSFKLNALVAAAMMAASAPALAVMADATSGNGELLVNLRFYAGDNNVGGDDISAVFDLGITMNDFIANAAMAGYTRSWDLAAANYGTAWNDVMTFAGANAGLIEYNVIALDNTNFDVAGGSRYLTTGPATFPSLTNQNLNGFQDMNGYVLANNSRGTHASEANGASTATSNDAGVVYFGKAFGNADGDTWVTKTTADTTKTLATAQNFWFLTTSSTTTTAQATKRAFGYDLNGSGSIGAGEFGLWSFNGSTLTFATPVPEASTYGMMLAGLGLVGFMARRRMNRAA